MVQERRNAILQALETNKRVKVVELSRKLKCSEVTIRNDIKQLEQEGLLKRTHGGAVSTKTEQKPEERKYAAESIYRNVEQKKAIAACAYEFIEDGDTIILDDASSSFYLALYIKEHHEKQIAVVTNSLLIGNELAYTKHVELYMIGGNVGGKLAATMGDVTVHNIHQFHVDKGFIGVHSINFQVGLTSIATMQMQVKRAIIDVSEEMFVLADSSKFGNGYVSVIGPISKVDKIITDNKIEEKYIEMAKQEEVELVVAEI